MCICVFNILAFIRRDVMAYKRLLDFAALRRPVSTLYIRGLYLLEWDLSKSRAFPGACVYPLTAINGIQAGLFYPIIRCLLFTV